MKDRYQIYKKFKKIKKNQNKKPSYSNILGFSLENLKDRSI